MFGGDDVEEVRAIARRPLGIEHPKLRGYVHNDFLDYTAVQDPFAGVTACFFCLGISATQVANEQEYRTITHDYALATTARAAAAQPANAVCWRPAFIWPQLDKLEKPSFPQPIGELDAPTALP